MKKRRLKTLFMMGISAGFFHHSHAQESVVSAGQTISNNSGTISYSLGITGHTYYASQTGETATLGVQHSVYEVRQEALGIADDLKLNASVYPNPATDHIIIQTNSNKSYQYKLVDQTGRVPMAGYIKENKTTLNMQNLGKSIYVLLFFDEKNNLVQKMKIIKK